MKKLLQFGAGKIGRSFLGQLFSRAGYEVVFVDLDGALVEGLNRQRAYRLVVKHSDRPDETQWIDKVRAIHGGDTKAIADEMATTSVVATAVGQSALPSVMERIAQGLEHRLKKIGKHPLDIILAENLHSAAAFCRKRLAAALPEHFPLDDVAGLVETSIGKMVPIMREEDLRRDPLWVFAEPYNRLIVDKQGFKNPIPRVEGLSPVENIKAYVDRKLFIHNLGHAATAYFGFQKAPHATHIHEALAIPEVRQQAKRAMSESARALAREYPDTLRPSELEAHIEDLLTRFGNRALGDTLYRVGRDLHRKLGKDDRLIGAILLCEKHALPWGEIARALVAGIHFRAKDEIGNLYPSDEKFAREEFPKGLEHILTSVSGLSRERPLETGVLKKFSDSSQSVNPKIVET